MNAGNRWRAYARSDFSHSPLLVFYEMTQACDLACTHCRACAQSRAHPGELDTASARRLIDQLTEFPKTPMLVMTGGDPLKRHDVYELIEYAANAGIEVSITPAATPLATHGAIRRLRGVGVSRLAVSIDGPDAATHDGLRGVAGSFQRTLDILDDARELQISTQVNTVVTRVNRHQIANMAELLAGESIALWSVFFLVPVGRAATSYCLSAEQCEQVFAELWRQTQRQPYLIKTTEAPHYRRYVLQRQRELHGSSGKPKRNAARPQRPPMGLNDGRGVMFVSHTGLIYPSGFMPILCGIFPQQPLVRVYQESLIFRGLRDTNRLEGKCGVCEFRSICGGSRARAYALTEDPFAQEPTCAFVPLSFSG